MDGLYGEYRLYCIIVVQIKLFYMAAVLAPIFWTVINWWIDTVNTTLRPKSLRTFKSFASCSSDAKHFVSRYRIEKYSYRLDGLSLKVQSIEWQLAIVFLKTDLSFRYIEASHNQSVILIVRFNNLTRFQGIWIILYDSYNMIERNFWSKTFETCLGNFHTVRNHRQVRYQILEYFFRCTRQLHCIQLLSRCWN